MATRMQQRRGTAAQWISTNSGNGPILNAGEIGWESDTNKFKIGDGTNTWLALDYFSDTNSTVNPAFGSSITFEGSTVNDFETTLSITNPTADRTITFPDATGTVVLEETLSASLGTYLDSADIGVIVAGLDADDNLIVPGVSIIIEGATANEFETILTVTDPTADRTITFPNATGTVVLSDSSGNVTVSGDLTVSGTTTTINSTTINATTGIVFEGATANDFETTLTVTDPTADRVITLPNSTGTVALTTDIPAGVVTETGTQTLTNKTLTSPVISGLTISDSSIIFEGSTDDTHETTITFANPTEDRTITFPNNSGTVAFTADISAATGGSVSETGTQTLTNKTIALGSNTVTGTFAQFNTAVTDTDLLSVADPAVDYYITNSDSGAYLVNGVSNGSLYLEKGKKYRIHVNATGHPFWIQTVSGAYSSGNLYSTGITNNGAQNGHIIVELAQDAPQLFYACQYHSSMAGSVVTGSTFATYKALANLSNVDNTADTAKPVSTATQTALDLKAALASPTFTGTPTLPTGTIATTQTAGNNSTALATTAFVGTAVANLVDSAPATLNTLNELAAALGSDPSFATTTATSLGLKAPLASPTFTGTVTIPSGASISGFAPLASPTFTGTVTFTGATVVGISSYSAPTIGSTSIASGATVTTIAGLTLTSPVLTTPSISTIDAAGDLLIGTADNTIGRIAIGPSTYVLTSNGTTAAWGAPPAGAAFSELMLIGA